MTRWDGSRRADELFGLLGIAHRPAPPLLGSSVFRHPQPGGTAAVAQAMLYNANPQAPDRPHDGLDPRDWQPVVGWDTLNWGPDVRVPEFRFGLHRDTDGRIRQPSVVVNWRARLTPVTLLSEAAGAAPDDELGRILRRADGTDWPGNTH